ncbi:MAG TPA: hypothetical protein VJN43_21750 [Bryobacteraceae bacterium]|nr:hypothetical protein [Bryobacteraceae bacterium]
MQSIGRNVTKAFLILVLPSAALADLSENLILQANSTLNLETGAVGNSGGDIVWDGSSIVPQGTVKLRNLRVMGQQAFDAFTKSYFSSLAPSGKTVPITADLLLPGDGIVALTSGGHVAKILVGTNGGGVISLRFTTFDVTPAAGLPLITDVLNNSSTIPEGYPNYGIAPSSIFIIVGDSLANPGNPVLQSSAAPGIPLALNGASISVVVNGVTTHPGIYYTSPKQIAAVLPAATPVGVGSLTVTYNGVTSAPTPIKVVASALGINMYYSNSGVATDGKTGALISFTNSGAPGQVIVLWTTGLGADPADSDRVYTLTPHKVNTPLQIYVGGVLAKILYQGASPYPGVNQINLEIPNGASSGCWVSVVAVAGAVIANVVTIPIHNGGGACVDELSGLNGNQIAPSGGRTLKTGLAALIQTHAPDKTGNIVITNSTDAAFIKYTGLYAPSYSLSPGGCLLNYRSAAIPGITGLDAGSITLAGPAGSPVTLKPQFKGAFYALLSADAIPSAGGTFTFTGTGGADVGAFTSTLQLSTLLNWTNPEVAANIDRSKDLHITWTGGNPGSYVYISGTSTDSARLNLSFICMAKADDGGFTVPSNILLGISAGTGGLLVQNFIQSPLPASGLDVSTAAASISFNRSSTYQ